MPKPRRIRKLFVALVSGLFISAVIFAAPTSKEWVPSTRPVSPDIDLRVGLNSCGQYCFNLFVTESCHDQRLSEKRNAWHTWAVELGLKTLFYLSRSDVVRCVSDPPPNQWVGIYRAPGWYWHPRDIEKVEKWIPIGSFAGWCRSSQPLPTALPFADEVERGVHGIVHFDRVDKIWYSYSIEVTSTAPDAFSDMPLLPTDDN